MATTLPSLLSSLQAAVESATVALPNEDRIIPPKDGISLLDVKNELLLSYLQNLVFLILLKIRGCSEASSTIAHRTANGSASGPNDLDEDVTKKLVELRVYLERGVRPLEKKLQYQIDKVVRAADDAARSASQKPKSKPDSNGVSEAHDNEGASIADEVNDEDPAASEVDELSYRPNPSSFARPAKPITKPNRKSAAAEDGVYRPPRVAPTAMPTTDRYREERRERLPRSRTVDEFVASEYSTAPIAEPSIGSTITSGGRSVKTQRDRDEERERTAYEEANMTRLPKESKADRLKKKALQGRGGRMGYGGEEWRGLGEGVDRIERMTKRKGGGVGGVLERSRKRAVGDSNRGSGLDGGYRELKKRKTR